MELASLLSSEHEETEHDSKKVEPVLIDDPKSEEIQKSFKTDKVGPLT